MKYIVIDPETGKPENIFKRSMRWTKEQIDNAAWWCRTHKEETKALIGLTVYGAAFGTKIYSAHAKKSAVKAEKALKELYVYDNHSRRYFKLRRPLRNSELLEIERREQNGERLGKILESLKVLQ